MRGPYVERQGDRLVVRLRRRPLPFALWRCFWGNYELMQTRSSVGRVESLWIAFYFSCALLRGWWR